MKALACIIAVMALVSSRPAASEEESSVSPRLFTGFVADVRYATLVRSETQYVHQAETFGYPVGGSAAGISGTIGVEIIPRVTLFGSGSYYGNGATREGFGKIMITSESLLAGLRFAVLRGEVGEKSSRLIGQIDLWGAGGRYWIRETYSDPLLSATTYVNDGGSGGFATGVDVWGAIGPLRMVLGYGFHYAPASIRNEIGGEVRAGGHEISIGLGVKL